MGVAAVKCDGGVSFGRGAVALFMGLVVLALALAVFAQPADAQVAPDAVDDSYRLKENDTLYLSGTEGVLRNDRDGDRDVLSATLVEAPPNGTLYLFASGGFSYEPKPNFEGTDTFTYEASDGNGGKDVATVRMNVEPDTSPPSVSFGSPGDGARVLGDVGFSANASDNVRMGGVEFLVDGTVVATDLGGDRSYSATWDSRSVPDGTHEVSARAFDVAGNSSVAKRNVVVDNVNPSSTIAGGPAEDSFVGSASASFVLSSTEGGSTFECRFDDGAVAPCGETPSFPGLSEGTHTLRAWAIGTAGRAYDLEVEPSARTWTVDTAVPTGTVKINKGVATTRRLAVTLNLSAVDAAPASGVAQMRFSHDGRRWTPWQDYAATKKWTLKKGKAGTRTVFAQFVDKAGNASTVAKDTIRYKP